MSADHWPEPERWSPAGRRVGYAVAVVVNLVLIYVVTHLLEWGWFSFLTDEFEDIVPILIVSLIVGATANLLWIFYDARWFKAGGQIVDNVTSLLVVIATLKVFPFDFSAYRINWDTITRVALVFIAFALVMATIAEFVKMIRAFAAIGSDQ